MSAGERAFCIQETGLRAAYEALKVGKTLTFEHLSFQLARIAVHKGQHHKVKKKNHKRFQVVCCKRGCEYRVYTVIQSDATPCLYRVTQVQKHTCAVTEKTVKPKVLAAYDASIMGTAKVKVAAVKKRYGISVTVRQMQLYASHLNRMALPTPQKVADMADTGRRSSAAEAGNDDASDACHSSGPAPAQAQEQADEELAHFRRVQQAFSFYEDHAMARLSRALTAFHRLPQHHQDMLPKFSSDMRRLREAIAHNAAFVAQITSGLDFLEMADADTDLQDEVPTEFFMDKVCTTIKQFYRDWSAEGQAERQQCYGRILEAVDRLFAERDRHDVAILTPGAGLGRLTWEFAKRGYRSQGNEWSAFMLFASNFILNSPNPPKSITIHPFAHLFSNVTSRDAQVRAIEIPDVDTRELPAGTNFSMAAGDFFEVYDEANTWDCVASAFTLDTARNPIAFLERVFSILKPGGFLVNLGPLLYHYEDSRDGVSLELPLDDVLAAAVQIGFIIAEEERRVKATYNDDSEAMMHTVFDCSFFIAQKPPSVSTQHSA
ncbi:hypothetical protein PTSG_11583 [Salpingoeca rosetta]|uniref:carnosine N-methyltransferase n=1 Tax=Salpingoeca rosetta (strain ATCC 50818 / BSB-021) TaxID=946362 RepID=F2TWD3_SALR5|nr:uncharacterized protein PTSG_11583 [Salpingoeca rosetta]EGD72379.1 hypothetical protein PTSG_11583 [Salpingoeca rosetta]|eukprot:XP_004998948.1 hypothetical protein PTSG_11583 [Salpingoeca rosetta]